MMKQMVHSAVTILVSFILQFCDHGTASAFAIIHGSVEFSNKGCNSNSVSNDGINTNTITNTRRQDTLHMIPQDVPRGGGRETGECGSNIDNGITSCSSTSKTRTTTELRATTTTSPPPPEQISSENWSLLSDRGKTALSTLIQLDSDGTGAQEHVYGNWPEVGSDDDGKVQLAEQVCVLHRMPLYCNLCFVFMLPTSLVLMLLLSLFCYNNLYYKSFSSVSQLVTGT